MNGTGAWKNCSRVRCPSIRCALGSCHHRLHLGNPCQFHLAVIGSKFNTTCMYIRFLALISESNAMPEVVLPNRRSSRPFSTESSDSLDISIYQVLSCITITLASGWAFNVLFVHDIGQAIVNMQLQNNQKKKLRNNSEQLRKNSESETTRKKNCARLRIFAHGLRIFCARLRFWFSPKCPKIVRNCPKVLRNVLRIGVRKCPKAPRILLRIGAQKCPK